MWDGGRVSRPQDFSDHNHCSSSSRPVFYSVKAYIAAAVGDLLYPLPSPLKGRTVPPLPLSIPTLPHPRIEARLRTWGCAPGPAWLLPATIVFTWHLQGFVFPCKNYIFIFIFSFKSTWPYACAQFKLGREKSKTDIGTQTYVTLDCYMQVQVRPTDENGAHRLNQSLSLMGLKLRHPTWFVGHRWYLLHCCTCCTLPVLCPTHWPWRESFRETQRKM